MPGLPAKICTHPGCSSLVTDGGNRCARHPKVAWARPGRQAGGTSERGYGHAWQKLRTAILKRDNYLCVLCLAAGRVVPARDVDHKLHKAAGGTDAPDNLQSLCGRCHAAKTQAEAHG